MEQLDVVSLYTENIYEISHSCIYPVSPYIHIVSIHNILLQWVVLSIAWRMISSLNLTPTTSFGALKVAT